MMVMKEKNHYDVEYPLLEREVWSSASRLNFFATREEEEVSIDSYFSQPGRFRSPATLFDRIAFFWQQHLKKAQSIENENGVLTLLKRYGFPYRWEVLFRYLMREGIGTDFLPEQCVFYHDQPKMISYRLALQGRDFGGRGNAFDVETALSKTVGESLERYFLSSGEKRVDKVGSVNDLRFKGLNFLHPKNLSHFSGEQRLKSLFLNFDDASVFQWVWCRHLVSGKKVLLPNQCVFFDQKRRDPALLRELNTNGGAGGFTFEEALLSALYELVERDGFLGHWLVGEAPTIIDTSDCQDKELSQLLSELKRYRMEAVFLDTTSDMGIPSCTCVLMNRSIERPYGIAVGCAAGFQPVEILKKSLQEALMVFGSMSPKESYPDLPVDYMPFSDKNIGLRKRMFLWRNAQLNEKILPWLSGEKKSLYEIYHDLPNFTSFEEEYQYTLGLFEAMGRGYEVYYHNVKDPVLDRVGYFVVRAIVPALIPFYLTESNAPLGSERLRLLFASKKKDVVQDINPWPHPLA